MKRILQPILIISIVAGLAACSNGEKELDIVGTWSKTFTWSTGTNPTTIETVIYPDGTYVGTGASAGASGRSSGRWSLDGHKFTLKLNPTPNGTTATYVGTVNDGGDTMDGTMSSSLGGTGTWSAVLLSRATPARFNSGHSGGETGQQ